jgi:hypothetical protein
MDEPITVHSPKGYRGAEKKIKFFFTCRRRIMLFPPDFPAHGCISPLPPLTLYLSFCFLIPSYRKGVCIIRQLSYFQERHVQKA